MGRRSSNKVATPASKTPTKAELLARVAELESAVASSAKGYTLAHFEEAINNQQALVDAARAAIADGSFDAKAFGRNIRNAAQANYNKGRRVEEGKASLIG